MIIGFTGTQKGMTEKQLDQVRARLIHPTAKVLHHGDCTGADEEAHAIMVLMGKPVEVHPPNNPHKRAFCGSLHRDSRIHEPKEYQARNQDIVDACDLLLATPRGPERSRNGGHRLIPYSGTWMTIRMARRANKPCVIIMPDGTIIKESFVDEPKPL